MDNSQIRNQPSVGLACKVRSEEWGCNITMSPTMWHWSCPKRGLETTKKMEKILEQCDRWMITTSMVSSLLMANLRYPAKKNNSWWTKISDNHIDTYPSEIDLGIYHGFPNNLQLAFTNLYHNLATSAGFITSRQLFHLRDKPNQKLSGKKTCDEWLVGGIPLKMVVFPLKKCCFP